MAAKNTEGPTSRTSLENPITGQGSKHGLKVLKGGGASEGLTVARKSKVTAKAHVIENTYRTEPSVQFKTGPVKEIIKDTLERILLDKTYENSECTSLSKMIADEIKMKVKKLDFKRYKIVCLVTIGQRKYQKVMVASRCLWNGSHDTCTSASYANLSLFATAMVFGVYFE